VLGEGPNAAQLSDALLLADFGMAAPEDAIGYAKFYSRSRAMIIGPLCRIESYVAH
jgi:hypothetical protein